MKVRAAHHTNQREIDDWLDPNNSAAVRWPAGIRPDGKSLSERRLKYPTPTRCSVTRHAAHFQLCLLALCSLRNQETGTDNRPPDGAQTDKGSLEFLWIK